MKERIDRQTETSERFPASISVSLLLTHGRSGRLFLTRHGVLEGESENWGLIAGGVAQGENAWETAIREAWEETHITSRHIIFVRGINQLEPHVALVRSDKKDSIGLVFDVTYSGPPVPLSGWEIKDDDKVDQVKLFSWKEVLTLIDNPSKIYRPEFNFHQLLRWTLAKQKQSFNEKRKKIIDEWLLEKEGVISGLQRKRVPGTDNFVWEYLPPYNSWMSIPFLHGDPKRTNFARSRFKLK